MEKPSDVIKSFFLKMWKRSEWRECGKPFICHKPFEDVWEHTLERHHINVKNVGKPWIIPVLKGWKDSLDKNSWVKQPGKDFSEPTSLHVKKNINVSNMRKLDGN